MSAAGDTEPGAGRVPSSPDDGARHAAWFHELDAWTEYWDVYHPRTCGRFYFGDGKSETGLLTRFLPRTSRPPVFTAWTRMALKTASAAAFAEAVRDGGVPEAIAEVDGLMTRLFAKHFGDARDPAVKSDYLRATFRFAVDALPAAEERDGRIADDDPRKPTAGRHTLDGDLMWFAWALHTEAAELVAEPSQHARRALFLAGQAMGCSANFAWRGHRRTREEYAADAATAALLHERGLRWTGDFAAAAQEVHALYRIREWGSPE